MSDALYQDCSLCGRLVYDFVSHSCENSIRSFPSGATRDTDQGKLDFEACLSPLVLEAFAEHMRKHRGDPPRPDDLWQKGIPVDVYMKSAWRHFFTVWRGHRGAGIEVEDLCALLFNVQGLLHETLKKGALTS